MKKPLRVHHILCTALYQGMGYDGAFCENMTAVVTMLREKADLELYLVQQPDMICQNCPNLTEEKECVQDKNHVARKDELLRQKLGLSYQQTYHYQELLKHTREILTKEMFDESCSNCRWYREGLCSYESFMECTSR